MTTTTQATCSVPECSEPTRRGALCYGHYMKQWRYGTTAPEHQPRHVDITGQRFGTLTVVRRAGRAWLCRCDCGRERTVSAGDLNRYGDRSTCGHKPAHRANAGTYSTAHMRVRADRGPIRDQVCVDCGEQAQHWSYDHTDPDERIGTSGNSPKPVPYSLNPDHYSPRCVPCHKRHDLKRTRT